MLLFRLRLFLAADYVANRLVLLTKNRMRGR